MVLLRSALSRYALCVLCGAAVLLLFRHDLQLLAQPDPAKAKVFTTQFSPYQDAADWCEITLRGFAAAETGLQLAPGGSATAVVSVVKAPEQGCLLRVWLYGDDGTKRPNSIELSIDGGRNFTRVA